MQRGEDNDRMRITKAFAEFQIMGFVTAVSEEDGKVAVRIASPQERSDKFGQTFDDTHRNVVVIFNRSIRKYVSKYAKQGIHVFVRGKLQSAPDATQLVCEEFILLSENADKAR